MPRPVNEELYALRAEQILDAARDHLAERGAGGFSLRAVAGRVGMAPNSIYHYFPGVDDLITELLVAAYHRLADAVWAGTAGTSSPVGRPILRDFLSEDAPPPDAGRWADRFVGVCLAYRVWAVANPTDYDLIFGRPLPNYMAPPDRTAHLPLLSFRAGLATLVGAEHAKSLHPPARYRRMPAPVAARMTEYASRIGPHVSPLAYHLMVVSWSRLHGMVLLENHGHYDDTVGDPSAFYRHAVEALADEIGLVA